jgi:hypothetical protein
VIGVIDLGIVDCDLTIDDWRLTIGDWRLAIDEAWGAATSWIQVRLAHRSTQFAGADC